MPYFLFDIGGSKMRFAVTDDCINCSEVRVIETPETYEESMEAVESAARDLAGGEAITGAHGGIAGAVNKDKSTLLWSPNNPDWVGKPVRRDLSERIGAPVSMENDTAVIALGEATYGAGRHGDIVAYMTISTGVGGSRVVSGRMDEKARSFEPGHQIIHCSESSSLADLNAHTLENRISGSAVEKRYGKKGYEITDAGTWEEITKEAAVGVYNTLLHWSPDVMVLGGSMVTGDPSISITELRNAVSNLAPEITSECDIVEAELGDINGIYGALAWSDSERRRVDM